MPAEWTEEEIQLLANATSLEEVGRISVQHLARIASTGSVIQLCGPMTTGGAGNLEANMQRFEQAIYNAAKEGHVTFNQIPIQSAIIRITDHHQTKIYNTDILDVLYAQIFECGHVKTAYFLPDWESSRGACWERERTSALGIDIQECPEHWVV